VNEIVVGSILTTVKEGQMIDRADELGYFAFGEYPALKLSVIMAVRIYDRWNQDSLAVDAMDYGRGCAKSLYRWLNHHLFIRKGCPGMGRRPTLKWTISYRNAC
jgi:hypothetical protein